MTVLKWALSLFAFNAVLCRAGFGIATPVGFQRRSPPMLSNPMPLDAALRHCFPFAGVTKSTLLDAIRQGKLNCSRLGRGYFVTEAAVQDWITSCRVEKKQGSGSENVQGENPVGSSLTEDANTQQAIAEAIGRRLRNTSSMNTPCPGTGQTQAKVIRPKFRSQKS